MASKLGPSEEFVSPKGSEVTSDPRSDIARREMQQLIASTLSEIQNEQGRHAERFDGFNQKLDRLTDKIEQLVVSNALHNATLQRIEPQVIRHNNLYKTVIGIIIGMGILLTTVTGLLYSLNAKRLDKLLSIVDSPTIEKLLKRDSK